MNLEIELNKAKAFILAGEKLAEIAAITETHRGTPAPRICVDWCEGSACFGHETLRNLIQEQVQNAWETMHNRVIADAQRALREARASLVEELERR